MVAGTADVQACEEIGGLARRRQHRPHPAFQVGDLGRHVVVGGVLETGIEITALFQIEEASHLVGSLIFEGGTLDDWNLSGFSLPGLVARVHAARADALLAHGLLIFFCAKIKGRKKTGNSLQKIGKYF